eukprot:TRINITY_DN432_c0_g1_i1.p1 TRINITY_DN432_c0_g1~~TRINITY_DN432_c0_g1_i1.p1  ORF type:complete len:298 (+),score=50.87 TRINITY_DN432_c0_g1_i1:42-935(+)
MCIRDSAEYGVSVSGVMFWVWVALLAVVLIILKLFTSKKGNKSEKAHNSVKSNFKDRYESIEEVQKALRKNGLESSNLIIAVDYTLSNRDNGRKTFGRKSLHHIANGELNPYQQAISIIGRTLEPFDEDAKIPALGFGDITTKDRAVFAFYADGRRCNGFADVLARYSELTPSVQLSGPTSFAPVIYEAIKIVQHTRDYHILVIIADGQVTNKKDTVKAIIEASKYPLSIIVVGVGDGPWETMEHFDDEIPERQFDNFQFVDFHKSIACSYPEPSFALAALMEIPQQFAAIRDLGLL